MVLEIFDTSRIFAEFLVLTFGIFWNILKYLQKKLKKLTSLTENALSQQIFELWSWELRQNDPKPPDNVLKQ